MKVLIKQAHIVCSSSPLHGQVKDILITDGTIEKIADAVGENADEVIAHDNLHVSIGWMDSFADFADPGHESRETIETGAAAAAAGGFTEVMLLPNSNPVVHNKAQVEYLVQKGRDHAVNIHPIGAVSKNAEGKDLAEMYDMLNSGAIAFSDGKNSIQDAGLLLKALQYVKPFGGTVIQIPEDKSIGSGGLMNEGLISTRMGLPGKPAISEEIMIARDIKLARYAGSKLHFTGVSSAKSLEYIKKAKAGGIEITCSVTPYHLYFCDEDLQQYDTNLKVNPPLRTPADRTALREGLADGTIDSIASHHLPQDWDNKTCEFEYAKAGMIGLESLFGVLGVTMSEWPLDKKIEALTVAPRKIFGQEIPALQEGAKANLTLFDPTAVYEFGEHLIQSRSKNSAFTGKQLRGKVIGIINGPKRRFNNN